MKKTWIYSSIIVIAGVIFMAIGLSNGEGAVVLTKAINVCLECIGIG